MDTERVQDFMDTYRTLHQQYVGVAYLGNPTKDYMAACQLVEAFTDTVLRQLAVIWLNADDAFATSGTRTVPKLVSRASHYAAKLKAAGR